MSETASTERTTLDLEVTTGDKISDTDLATISNMFRETFANPPYGQFLFYSSEGKPISAQNVFGEDKKYVDSAQLDAYDPKDYPRNPMTGEAAIHWMNPELTRQILRKKFRPDLHIALLREADTGSIAGVNYGYFSTFGEAFQDFEEWGNPLLYSGIQNPKLNRNSGEYLEKLQTLLKGWMEIREDTRIFVLSCTLLLPAARGGDSFMRTSQALMDSIPPDLRETKMFHELITGSYAQIFVKALGGVELPDFFGENHELIVTTIGKIREQLHLPANDVSRKIRNTMLERKKGYIPATDDCRSTEVKSIEGKGRGVFAKENIPTGTIIASFNGQKYEVDKISDLHNEPPIYLRDRVIQVGEKEYIHGADGLAELLNHSCTPNCGLKDEATIITMRDIEAGEELNWDYAMSEDSDWKMEGCRCGSANCRGTITSYRDLPEDVRKQYSAYISPWLKKKYCM